MFGEHALVHRCHRHKERNVCDLLPERDRPMILVRIRGAWALSDHHLARERLELLASELERTWPDAAASLREGMTTRCDADAARDRRATLKDAVLDEPVRVDDRDRPLHAAQREALAGRRHAQTWTAAGMLVAEQQFRRIIGYRDLAKLVIAIERHALLVAEKNRDRHETREPVTV